MRFRELFARRSPLIAFLVLAFVAGSCFPDDSPRISIEFGAIPELEGSDVVIDGAVVGKLEKTGQATRVSFPVKTGQHEVCVKSPQFECHPAKVNAELKGQKIRLLLNVEDSYSIGQTKPTIGFQY